MQDRITKCLGLTAQYSPLQLAPGALLTANDCSTRRENIFETRRGFKAYATLTENVEQLLTYQNRILVHRGTTIGYDNGSGTFASYAGSYAAQTGTRIRGVEAFSNLYATTSAGTKVFSNITGTAARLAGAPRSLDPSYTLPGVTGFLVNAFQCAYRCAIQRTDANSVVVTGYPSQRLWVPNIGATASNVALTIYVPSEAAAGDVLQVFRTAQSAGTSADSSGDEMGLVYQYELVAADLTAGFITFTDLTVDDLRGATLYTSPSQEGITQANDRPPLAKDICLYKSNYMLYANTQTKQRLFVTLVGATSLSARTITLGGITYSFGATEIISGGGSPQARVSATGVAATDIDLTARSLVRVINRYALNTTVYAYYDSGPNDLPGRLIIEEKGVGASAFTLQASDAAIGGMFFPAPPVSPSTNTKSKSSNSIQKNAVYYSKTQQPEHVPALNYLLVGPSNKEILRILPLRESAIVIKEEGIYRISGETPQSFTVVPVDLTVFCRALESACVVANQVIMLSNQGVVSISENGVQVISHDIEQLLTPLLSVSALKDYTSAYAYESDRSYVISTITTTAETQATQTLVYNLFTRTWVRHTYAFKVGIVESALDKYVFAKPASPVLYIERKSFSDSDFADPEYTIAITAISIANLTVDFTLASVTPRFGWVIEQLGSEVPIKSLAVITGGFRATLESAPPASWTAGAANIFPAVGSGGMDVEWQPWTGGSPDTTRQVSQCAILADDTLNDNSASAVTFTFRTNFDTEREDVTITLPRSAWGSAWGSSPWGGGADPVGYPNYLPRNKQYSSRLTFGVKHPYARQKLVVAGCAFSFNPVSERIGR